MPLVPGSIKEGHSDCPLITPLETDELGTGHNHRDHRVVYLVSLGSSFCSARLGASFSALILSLMLQPPAPLLEAPHSVQAPDRGSLDSSLSPASMPSQAGWCVSSATHGSWPSLQLTVSPPHPLPCSICYGFDQKLPAWSPSSLVNMVRPPSCLPEHPAEFLLST